MMRERIFVPVLLCVIGALGVAVLAFDDSPATPGQPDEWVTEQRDVLDRIAFPLYAPDGEEVELNSWGGTDGEPVTSASVRHDESDQNYLEVDSDADIDAVSDAAERLEDTGEKATATGPRAFMVDGVSRTFTFAQAKDDWVAVGRLGDVVVTVRGHGVDPSTVRIRALADPPQIVKGGVPSYRPLRPNLDVLDPRRISELASDTSLKPLGAQLAAQAKPAFSLQEVHTPQPSWTGGKPKLPADVSWPNGHFGPMLFVAQLDLAGLDRKVWTGPTAGTLHVFCDVDPENGSLEDSDGCAILHSPATATLTERDFPPKLDSYSRLPQTMVVPAKGLTIPDTFAQISDPEPLWNLQERLRAEQGWSTSAGELLGWPAGSQSDDLLGELSGETADPWTLLLQTGQLDGILFIGLPTKDLEAGRFDHAEATIEFD